MFNRKSVSAKITAALLALAMLSGCSHESGNATLNQTIFSSLNITMTNEITVINDNLVTYNDDNGLEFKIEPAEDDDISAPIQLGETRSGIKWKANEDTIVVDSKKITVVNNDKKKDNGKIAAVAEALTAKTGYSKNKDDYNHNYAVYYIQEAQCLFYYPKQLTLIKEGEDQSLIFRDSRSAAELRVTLDENPYACMDDVESFISKSENSQILASGTDWYSSEKTDKAKTSFTLSGLGNKYIVNASLSYENKYDFVFNELRKLLKCNFVGDGIWVSNAKADTGGRQVAALAKSPGAYDPVLQSASYYLDTYDCIITYPDIFTKVYFSDDNFVTFTDPVTGAYLLVTAMNTEDNIGEIQASLDAQKSDLVNDHALKAANEGELAYITVRDGKMWTAIISYDPKYSGVYSSAYDMLKITLEGEEISNTEMKEIYHPEFNCYITVPIQFRQCGFDDNSIAFCDEFTGLEARLSFSEMTAATNSDNLFDMFEVVADESNISLGEDYIKWHNKNGLFMGGAGRTHAGLLEITYPNAYDVYKGCWPNFSIAFSEGNELVTDAEEIRQQTVAAVVIDTAMKERATQSDDPSEFFGVTKPSASIKKSNTAKKLTESGIKLSAAASEKISSYDSPSADTEDTGRSDAQSKDEQPNILFYKSHSDYLDVTTPGYEWLYYYPATFIDQEKVRLARFYTILYSINVLIYNGYVLPEEAYDYYSIYEIADTVDEYIRLLEESGSVSSQLGDGIISVFEVLCVYLGIDIPIYILEEYPSDSGKASGSQVTKPAGSNDADSGSENKNNTPDQSPSGDSSEINNGSDLIRDDSTPKSPREALQVLPFDEVSSLNDEYSYHGDLSYLEYETNPTSLSEIRAAMDELYSLGFSCTEKIESEWQNEYLFLGYLPGTAAEMYIYVTIGDSSICVLYLFTDEYCFGGPGTLSINRTLDYQSCNFMYNVSNLLKPFLSGVIEYEKNPDFCYQYSEAVIDFDDYGMSDYLQSSDFGGPSYRDCSIIYAGNYINGEFVAVHTYCYLMLEGLIIQIDDTAAPHIINFF